MKYCEICGHQMNDDANYCEKCGSATVEEILNENLCRSCQNELEEGMSFCPKCGKSRELPTPQKPLSDIKEPEPVKKLSRVRKRIKIMKILIVSFSSLVGLALCGLLLWVTVLTVEIGGQRVLVYAHHVYLYENEPIGSDDFEKLASIKNMFSLQFSLDSHIPNFDNIKVLANHSRLKVLEISAINNFSLSDISALAGFINLERLGLYYNNINDLTPLHGLYNLRELTIIQRNLPSEQQIADLKEALPNCDINIR